MNNLSKTIQRFKKIVFQSTKPKDKVASLHILKDNYSIPDIKRVIPHIETHPVAKRYLYGAPLPKSYKELRDCFYTYETNFEKELDWLCITLTKYSEEINKFIISKSLFEKNLLLGQYEESKVSLADINSKICFSLWGIENGLLLEELMGGLKKNKEFLSKLNNEQLEILTSLFTDFYSNKAERQLSSIRYNSILEEFVRDLDIGFQQYWSIKLNYLNTTTFTEFIDILTYDSKSSIVDRYLTFLRICQWIALNGTVNQKDLIIPKISLISKRISDPLLSNLISFFNPTSTINLSKENQKFLTLLDHYTEGNYSKSLDMSKEMILENPNELSIYEVYIKSLFHLDLNFYSITESKSLVNEILEDLYNIYAKNENTGSSIARLTKTANMLDSFAMSHQLYSFIEGLSPDKGLEQIKHPFFLNTYLRNPCFFKQFIDKDQQIAFLKAFKLEAPNSITLSFLESFILNSNLISFSTNDSIPYERIKFYQAKAAMIRLDFTEAITILEELKIGKNNQIFNEEILVNLFYCYREALEFDKCIYLYVDNYITNNNNILRFELKSIAKIIEREKFKNVSPSIYLPLFFLITKQDNHSTNVALRVFLRNMGMKRPPELVESSNMFDKVLLVELLLNVCIPEVLKYSTYFNSTKEILTERLIIFQLLTQINPDDTKFYKYEISRLSQQLAIIEGVREVDESKIYVDEKGLINNEFTEIQNNFNRYVEISNLIKEKPFFFIDIFSNKTILYKALDIKFNDEEIEKAMLSKNIKFSLFKELFYEILDKFLFSNQYGLDSYLSTRIRHGTLLGQFRSEFQKQHLITQKDKVSDEYYRNDYWNNKTDVDSQTLDLIQDLLANFSSKIDHIANDLKENYIQIKTSIKGTKGLFDYVFKEVELSFYFDNFFKNVDIYEKFIAYVLTLIWEKTKTNLEIIQNIISVKIKAEVIDNLVLLEKELKETVDDTSQIQELVNNIANCRTNIISQIDTIADWFKKRENITSDFKINKVFDTSVEITKKISQINLINIKSVIKSDTLLKGEFFIHFFDIIKIFLENAVSYSKLDSEELQLEISANEHENILAVEIINNLAVDFDLKKLEIFFEKRRSELETQGWNVEKLKTEIGGTGFFKAKKILTTNLLNQNNHFNFSVDEDRKVKIRIEIDLTKIKV